MAGSILEMALQIKYKNPHQALDVDIPEWTVFEVPALLRAKSPASFQNKGLEFGLHHRTLEKSQIEVFKIDIARILHSKLASRKSSWDQFAHAVVGDVNVARRAYSASSARYNDEEVQHLLALDALFLVVLFKFVNGGEFFLKELEALAGRLEGILTVIDRADFFLIDNQVPMYLLQSAVRQLCDIDEETEAKRVLDPTFQLHQSKVEDELEMILNVAVIHLSPFIFPENYTSNVSPYECWRGSFCSQQMSVSQNSKQRLHQYLISTYPVEPLEKSLLNCQHILDCLYRVICGHSLPFKVQQDVDTNLTLENIPSATRLEEIGIHVVGTAPTLRDVKLSGSGYLRSAKLQLPKVALFDYSEAAFHNLVLHEQLTSEGLCGDLRGYLQCMACLCRNVSDVEVLSERGLFDNHITSKETLLDMWDRTRKGILGPILYPSNWVECNRRIHQHRSVRWKSWRHECWALFFAKPWTLVSVLAGVMLLFLTATQTWLTAFPHKS